MKKVLVIMKDDAGARMIKATRMGNRAELIPRSMSCYGVWGGDMEKVRGV